jgi:tellurite resistance protein
MIQLLTLFQVLLELFADIGRTSSRKLVQPVLTALCLIVAYTAIHVTQEGSVAAGIRAAFFDNETARSERRRLEEQATLQTELRQFAAANKLIDQLLESMLARAAGASRVRLNVIHNGVTGLTGVGLLRYDVTNSVAAAGRLPGMGVTNQPLSDWSDFLPALLAGQCSLHRIADLHGVSIRARFDSFGATSILVCPAADVQGKTVGAIFIFWDGNDPVPDGADLRGLMTDGQHLGSQIAAVLDLRGPPPGPLP